MPIIMSWGRAEADQRMFAQAGQAAATAALKADQAARAKREAKMQQNGPIGGAHESSTAATGIFRHRAEKPERPSFLAQRESCNRYFRRLRWNRVKSPARSAD
jgi:hypothetical protein